MIDTPPSGSRVGATMSGVYTATELADLHGISPRVVRFYEAKGLLASMRVNASRCFTERDRRRLELIVKGKRLGFTLLEIKKLLATDAIDADDGRPALPLDEARISERLRALTARRDALDQAIAELKRALDRCA